MQKPACNFYEENHCVIKLKGHENKGNDINSFSFQFTIHPRRPRGQSVGSREANSSGAEFLLTISKFVKRMNFVIRDLKIEVFRHFPRTANVKKSRD